MAVIPRDIPISREQVYGWIEEWNVSDRTQSVEEFITNRINGMGLEDPMVNVSGHDQFGDEMPISEYIVETLPTYSNYAASS